MKPQSCVQLTGGGTLEACLVAVAVMRRSVRRSVWAHERPGRQALPVGEGRSKTRGLYPECPDVPAPRSASFIGLAGWHPGIQDTIC